MAKKRGNPGKPKSDAHRKAISEALKKYWEAKEDRTIHPTVLAAARRPKTEAHRRAIGEAQRKRLAAKDRESSDQ